MAYTVYIIECKDNTLYTGIAKDIKKRFAEHKSGKGARYTRSHPVKKIVYTEKKSTLSGALRRELKIKAMKRPEKIKLLSTHKKISKLHQNK